MKRAKQFAVAFLLLFALATVTSACTSGKYCQATKVGNHR